MIETVTFIAFLLIVLPGIIFYILQPKIVFSPQHYKRRLLFAEYPLRYQAVELIVDQNVRLEGIVYEPENEPSATVLFFGGKEQDSVSLIAKFSMHYPDLRFVAFNYRAYGTSGSKPTEKRLHSDAITIYNWTASRYGEITLLGYSLGSNIAAFIATRKAPQKVILVGAFESVTSLMRETFVLLPNFIIRYKFNTLHYVKSITVPLYLYAAIEDQVVPIHQARRLKENVPNLSKYKEISGYNHGELLFSPEMMEELSEVFKA
ncbi:MAG: hypothetical protein DRG24_05785 [Epsilonproteobacteria bacterium]|nr:MAG: hypothetical protein DRG24_05785 [Campylobacterota bacterium]